MRAKGSMVPLPLLELALRRQIRGFRWDPLIYMILYLIIYLLMILDKGVQFCIPFIFKKYSNSVDKRTKMFS